jgi:hypothetical protein
VASRVVNIIIDRVLYQCMGVAGISFTGTGNGEILVKHSRATVSETWTLTYSGTNDNWSVSGSVAGAQSNKARTAVRLNQNDVYKSENREIEFIILDGSTDFVDGDVFVVTVVASLGGEFKHFIYGKGIPIGNFPAIIVDYGEITYNGESADYLYPDRVVNIYVLGKYQGDEFSIREVHRLTDLVVYRIAENWNLEFNSGSGNVAYISQVGMGEVSFGFATDIDYKTGEGVVIGYSGVIPLLVKKQERL